MLQTKEKKKMSDNIAVLDGFTVEVESIPKKRSGNRLFLLVKPDTDFTGTFKAWSTDDQEYISVYGPDYTTISKKTYSDLETLVELCDIAQKTLNLIRCHKFGSPGIKGIQEDLRNVTLDVMELWQELNKDLSSITN